MAYKLLCLFSDVGVGRSTFPLRGKASWRTRRVARRKRNVSDCPILRRRYLAGFLFQGAAASFAERQDVERVSRFACPYAALSVSGGNGVNELDLQSAFHVLVNAHMRLTVCVVERPGTELIYVAVVMQQHKLHCFGIPGDSCVNHRIRQRLSAFVIGLFQSRQPPFGMRASNLVRSCLRVLVL